MIAPPTAPHAILFVTSNLGGGGAERALVTIINGLDRTRFRPYLALFQKEGALLDEISPDVEVYEIQPQDRGMLCRNWARMSGLRHLHVRIRPSVIMSVLWQANTVTLLAAILWRLRVPVVINEQIAPQASLRSNARRRLVWPLARPVYRRASHVVAISEGIAKELADDRCVRDGQFSVIHNPIPLAQVLDQAVPPADLESDPVPAILAAGRLVPQKNYPLLLRATALVLRHVEVNLFILGEGPERQSLERLASVLNISDHVHLLGFHQNPYPFFSAADLFVLTSDYEGFGNVLVEALLLGVPVISTDCPYGPAEILANGRYGVLVPRGDVDSLADAILCLLSDPERRDALSASGRRRAASFSAGKIVPRYEELFAALAGS